jgi:hypothetical protein
MTDPVVDTAAATPNARKEEEEEGAAPNNEVTYEGILQDKDAIDSMYYSLQSLGNTVEYNPKEILDAFLTHKRYFDTNIAATAFNASKILGDDFDDDTRKLYAYSSQLIDQMPNFGDGSAPLLPAVVDYVAAAGTDPTNILSGVAAAFTFGAGGVAGLTAKEAAKQGFKSSIKAKLRAAIGKQALKSYAVEGTISGAGGVAQQAIKQKVEKDIGIRDDYEPEYMVLQGAVEGVAGPAMGIAGSVIGSSVLAGAKETAKGVYKGVSKVNNKFDIFTDLPDVENATAWLKRNLLPTAGLSDTEARIIERTSGQVSSLKERGQKLTEELDVIEFPNKVDLLNKAFTGNAGAVAEIKKVSPEADRILKDFNILRKEAWDYGSRSALNEKARKIFLKDANYVRNVPEVYAVTKRLENFEDFIKNNTGVVRDLKKEILRDPTNVRWEKNTKPLLNNKGTLTARDISDENVTEIIRNLYTPNTKLRKEGAVFRPTKDITELSDTMKKIIGYNNRPALRVADTINGIVDLSSRANAARDLANDASLEGLGTSAKSMKEAIKKLGTKDVMSLVGSFNKGKKLADMEEEVMRLPHTFVDDKLKNFWVTKEHGEKLAELFSNSNYFLGGDLLEKDNLTGIAYKGLLKVQATAKAGKTIFSPLAEIRNIASGLGYTAAGGNTLGLIRGAKEYISLDAAGRKALVNEFQELGLKGSNIDLNQTLKRFGDLTDSSTDGDIINSLMQTGGLSVFGTRGKKVAKGAQKLYGATDDLFKFLALSNEKVRAKNVFNGWDSTIQAEKIAEFGKKFNIIKPTKEQYISERAANNVANTTPIYSRIPKILEKSRAIPVVGSFTAYPAERLRNSYNIFKIATDELQEGFKTGNKALTRAGMSRLSQWTVAQSALLTAAYTANEVAGFGDTAEKLRSLLPDWDKDGAILVTGKDDKGNWKYHNLSYLNPDTYVLEGIMPIIMKAARGMDVTKNLDDSFKNAFVKIATPYVSPSLAVEAGAGMLSFFKDDDENGLLKAYKALEPGWIRMARDMSQSAGAFDDTVFGTKIKDKLYPRRFNAPLPETEGALDYAAKNGFYPPGVKQQTFNPQKTMGYALNNIKKNIGTDNSFAKDLKKMLADPNTRYNKVDILNSYKEVLEDRFAAQSATKKLFNDMEGLVTKQELFNMLDSLGLDSVVPSKKATRSILNTGKSNLAIISDQDNLWKDINKSLLKETKQNYFKELSELRNDMRQLEAFFKGRDLLGEVPEINIE